MRNLPIVPLLLSPLFCGCAHYQPLGMSSASVGSRYERPIGMAEGKAIRWNFFPCYSLCAVGDDSLISAVNDALEGRTGDALSNVYSERITTAFPHVLLPLITRTEVRVMGTMVKYNTKEFPPDRDYVYSGIPGEMWSQLLSFSGAERDMYSKGLSDRNRRMLVDFALKQEEEGLIEAGSKDSEVFALFLLREPRTVTPKSVLRSEAAIDLEECDTYECVITLSPEKQAEALKLMNASDGSARARFINSARRRIKACYPGKARAVVIPPEVRLIYNEGILLETLCNSGELNS